MEIIFHKEQFQTIIDHLKTVKNVTNVKIATAFISDSNEMLSILKSLQKRNQIKKENYEIFLSPDFSSFKRKEILEKLLSFANVYMITNLHAKVYWIKGDSSLTFFGSSNYTENGFNHNLELVGVCDEETLENDINKFFNYCKQNAYPVTEQIIEILEQIDCEQVEIEKLVKNKKNQIKKLRKQLIETSNTILAQLTNTINSYFNENDCIILNDKNAILNTQSIQKQRKETCNKLVKIHNSIVKKINIMRLFQHYNEKRNLTNLIQINTSYNNKINWIGIRYWNNLDKLKYTHSDQIFSSDYACLQYNLSEDGFEVGLFHSPDNNRAIDRDYLRKNFNSLKNEIVSELKEIKKKTKGYQWVIWDKDHNVAIFKLDQNEPEEFVKWYQIHDKQNTFSSLMLKFDYDDPIIYTKEQIEQLILEQFQILYKLYNLIIDKTDYRGL